MAGLYLPGGFCMAALVTGHAAHLKQELHCITKSEVL